MHVCIVGAGPVGLLQSLFLVKYSKSFRKLDGALTISIYERRSQQDLVSPSSEQRSINLALSWRGMRALESVGLLQEVLKHAVPMHGRYIHPLKGDPYIQSYSSHPEQIIYSIERLTIQKILLKSFINQGIIDEEGIQVKLNFRQQLMRLQATKENVILDFTTIKTVKADLVLGCDGAFSRVRTEMIKCFPGKVIQETFQHQYREFKVPASAALAPLEFLHIWPRKNLMLIALPNYNGGFTATLFCDFEKIDSDPINFFHENFPEFLQIVGEKSLLKDWQDSSANKLITFQVNPIGIDRIVLLGDAAHSILPFYGQGMNAGFEDVQILTNDLLKSMNMLVDLSEILSKYSFKRVKDARALDLLARENYNEMRDHVLSSRFLLKTRFLQTLNKYFPTTFIPRYSIISFSSIPYSFIKKREMIQDFSLIILIGIVIALIFSDL